MGTNYYLRYSDKVFENATDFFLRKKDEIQENSTIHIGKSSCGWRFMFQELTIGEEVINTFAQWEKLINQDDYEIIDEYGRIRDKFEFFTLVENKQNEECHLDYGYYGQYLSKDGYDFSDSDFS